MTEQEAASAQVDIVRHLLQQRKLKIGEKKTTFGTYLDCVKKEFAKDWPGKVFYQHLVTLTESIGR
jgi:hypothetical protein